MLFEHADMSDIAHLTDMRVAYLEEDNGGLSESDSMRIRDILPDYFKRNLNKSIFGYVARDGERIAACALLLVVEKPCSPAFPTGKTGTVLNVYTRPEYRRKGYARELMKMLLAEAAKENITPVELKATDAGYPLYQSLGFQDTVSKYHPMKWDAATAAGVSGTDLDNFRLAGTLSSN